MNADKSSNNFVIIKSSAGSGKTYIIVQEYIKLLLLDNDSNNTYKKILALTFTNKAVLELKERIFDFLTMLKTTEKEIIKNDFPNKFIQNREKLLQHYEKEILKSRNSIILKSQKIYNSILHNISDLNIITIDKFMLSVIRSFSQELGFDSNIKVELNSELIYHNALNQVNYRLYNNEKLNKLFKHALDINLNNYKKWNFIDELIKIYKFYIFESNYFKLKSLINDEEKISSISQKLQYTVNENKNILIQESKLLKKIVDSHSLILTKNGSKRLNKYSNADELLFDYKIIKDLKLKKDNSNGLLFKKYETNNQTLIKDIEVLLNNLYTYLLEYHKCLHFLVQMNIFEIIKKIVEEIELNSKISNQIDLAKCNKLIFEHIKDIDAPYIYEKTSNRFEYFLIDEFQDTSIMQWQNIIPLVSNSLSSGNSTILVGDAKQAIYKFRNGDFRQFSSLPNIKDKPKNNVFDQHEKLLKNNFYDYYKEKNLKSTNYRSSNQIIDFNNSFFDFLKGELKTIDIKDIYENCTQNKTDNTQDGFVIIDMINNSNNISKEFIVNVDTEEINENINGDDKDIDKIIHFINKLVKKKKYNYNDITILVSTNKEIMNISTELENNNIKTNSENGFLLKNNSKILFLTSFLYYTQNKEREIHKFYILNFIHNSKIKNIDIDALLLNNNTLKNIDLAKIIEINKDEISKMNFLDLMYYLIENYKLNKDGRDEYINSFIDFTMENYNRKNSLSEFINEWELNNEKLCISSVKDIESVNITTIHKSKGLSYPIVILPNMNWKIVDTLKFSQGMSLYPFEDEMLPINNSILNIIDEVAYNDEIYDYIVEKINLLYVAYTRAEKGIIILSEQVSDKNIENNEKLNIFLSNFINKNNEMFRLKNNYYIHGKIKKSIIQNKDTNFENKITTNNSNIEIAYQSWKSRITISTKEDKITKDTRFGKIIHQLLSNINKNSDIEKYMKYYKVKGLYKNNEENEILTELYSILNIKEYNELLNNNKVWMSERTLIDESRNAKKPDKILIDNVGNLIIIDFKTGKIKKTEYLDQVSEYANILSKITDKRISKFLLYSHYKELIEIK